MAVGDKFIPAEGGGWIRLFRTREEFDEFASKNDAIAIRIAFDRHLFDGAAGQAAAEWLLRHERQTADRDAAVARTAQERTVRAAERSARWTIWAAVGACASALVSALTVIIPLWLKK